MKFNVSSSPHLLTVPTHVHPKLVWVRPGCKAFLTALSEFATVSIWSSMRLNTTLAVTRYLFKNITSPKVVQGQEHCFKIPTVVAERVTQFLKVKGTDKEVFLKTLSKGLFTKYIDSFTGDNTIIVDDSPYKHVENDPSNVLLSYTWSYKGDGRHDSFLLDILLPWLRKLHNSADLGLSKFRAENPLGRPAMSAEPDTTEYIDLVAAIEMSKGVPSV